MQVFIANEQIARGSFELNENKIKRFRFGALIRLGKIFQSQGFPQQQLYITNMDIGSNSAFNIDRSIHFRATNQSTILIISQVIQLRLLTVVLKP